MAAEETSRPTILATATCAATAADKAVIATVIVSITFVLCCSYIMTIHCYCYLLVLFQSDYCSCYSCYS